MDLNWQCIAENLEKEIRDIKQEYKAEELLRARLGNRFEAQVRLTKKREEKIKELSERNRELAEKLRELYEQSKSMWGADLEIEKLLEGVE